MISSIPIHKPKAIEPEKEVQVFKKSSDLDWAIGELEAGNPLLIKGAYSNGLNLLKAIKIKLAKRNPKQSFKDQRANRALYNQLSKLVLLEVINHQLTVKKAPVIGWLEELYPENDHFLLAFPQVQGLNSSWQWYVNGVQLPVLRNKLKPYYGTYFPTRYDHLILFDNWLKRYEGPKKSAFDVGIGSGVLAFQLVKHGFQKVFGTDINPNAIVGLKAYMGDTKLSRKVELEYAPLFGNFKKQTELIVFNPPWLPDSQNIEGLDEAIYYNDKLFPDFFTEAKKWLLPEGKLILLFSNLAQITNVTIEHPIAKELAEGGRFKLIKCLKRPVKMASEKTKRNQEWRSMEEVELWILSHA